MMTKWFRILPVAMWAGGISVPAHALQVRAASLPGAIAPAVDERCRDAPAALSAPVEALSCPPADAGNTYDAWGFALFPAAAQGSRTLPAQATAVAAADAPSRVATADADEPAQLLARMHLNAARSHQARSGWVGQVLAGLATVGLVARRRLAWRARTPAPFPPHAPASPPRAASLAPYPAFPRTRPSAQRSRAVPAGGERHAV